MLASGVSPGRTRFATTPGRLRLRAVVAAVVASTVGLAIAVLVVGIRADAANIADEQVPAIVNIRQVQTELAAANAAASVAFLAGGVENREMREVYERSLASAARHLEVAIRLTNDDDSENHALLASLVEALPRYSGLIETARANNRQGFPVGAAYLESAAALLRDEIFPATDDVANNAAQSYRSAYDSQRQSKLFVYLAVGGVVLALIVFLIVIQLGLSARFKRTLNLPLVGATLAAIGLLSWQMLAIASYHSGSGDARQEGYRATRLYLDLRTDGFAARANQARFLIARGAGEQFNEAFEQRAQGVVETQLQLDEHLSELAVAAGSEQELLTELTDIWSAYVDNHQLVVEQERAGRQSQAAQTVLGESNRLFFEFDRLTAQGLVAASEDFDHDMAGSVSGLRTLQYGGVLIGALVAALSVYGLQLRINEYR